MLEDKSRLRAKRAGEDLCPLRSIAYASRLLSEGRTLELTQTRTGQPRRPDAPWRALSRRSQS